MYIEDPSSGLWFPLPPSPTVENYDHAHDYILEIVNHSERWDRLLELDHLDHASFRVLFTVEVGATMEWKEPTLEKLRDIFLAIHDGRLGFEFGAISSLYQAIWPLQIAKREVQKMDILWSAGDWKRYPFGGIALPMIACIMVRWAFETIANDVAGILLEERADQIKDEEKMMIRQSIHRLDTKGAVVEEPYYQPVDHRIRYIFRLATGTDPVEWVDDWCKAVELKKYRDDVIHRLGTGSPDQAVLGKLYEATLEGERGVSNLISHLFLDTPEFA